MALSSDCLDGEILARVTRQVYSSAPAPALHLQLEPRIPRAAVGRLEAGLPDAAVILAVGEIADAGEQFQPRRELPVAREIDHGVGGNLRRDESRAVAGRCIGILPV